MLLDKHRRAASCRSSMQCTRRQSVPEGHLALHSESRASMYCREVPARAVRRWDYDMQGAVTDANGACGRPI